MCRRSWGRSPRSAAVPIPILAVAAKVGPGCIRVPRRFRGTVDYAVRAPEAATVQQIGRDTAGGYGRRRLL